MGPDQLLAGGLLLADAAGDAFPGGNLLTGGVAGILALVIAYLLNSNRKDRKDFREAVAAQATRDEARVAAAERRYDGEVADHAKTQQQLDDERSRRRRVEDQLGRLETEVAGLREQVKSLETEVARLRPGEGRGAP